MLTFAYEYADHPKWERLATRNACADIIRAAFKRIKFDTSLNCPMPPDGMKRMVKCAAEALKSGDVLVVYYFGHGLAHADNQYLATEDGLVCTRGLRDVVTQAVVEKGVSDATFLLLLDCCRNEDAQGEHAKYDWASESKAHSGTHPDCRDDSVIVDARRLGITVSYSTCPGT